MRILVDFDQTIVPSSEAIFEVYKEETGSKAEYTSDHSWDFDGLLPKDYVPRAIELFDEAIFYEKLKPYPMAIEVLRELSEKHEIVIVSKHSNKGRYYKTKWIEANLPFAKVHYTSTFDKSEVSGDIAIDDKIECLNSLESVVKHCICFGTYRWNADWKGLRCENWTEVFDYISNITVKSV